MSQFTSSDINSKLQTLSIKDRLRMIVLIADEENHMEISQHFLFLSFSDNDTVIRNYNRFMSKLTLLLVKTFTPLEI